MEQITLHLSSTASCEAFPNNSAGAFTNNLSDVVHLDPNSAYEVAIANIFIPEYFHALIPGDVECGIEILGISSVNPDTGELYLEKIGQYTPSTELPANLVSLIGVINKELTEYLLRFYKGVVNLKDSFFSVDRGLNKIRLTPILVDPGNDAAPLRLFIKCGSRLADILGMDALKSYPIVQVKGVGVERSILLDFPHHPNAAIQYLLVYTDIIERSHYGDALVNILDCVSLPNRGQNSGFHTPIYKRINRNTITSVSIRITDQVGRPIYFHKNGHTLVTLKIKKII